MGGTVAAICPEPPDSNRMLVDSLGLPFPVLSDPDLSAARAYSGIHAKGGKGGSDLPRPTTVIIGKDGKVRWVNQFDDIRTRPDPQEIVRALQTKI